MVQLPRSLLASAAWIALGSRGRNVVLVINARFNGYNNGQIAISIEEIGRALGNQNHGSNGRALVAAIEHGFVECMADADHRQSKAREYRLTYIETGPPGKRVAATHEYRAWRPSIEKKQHFLHAQSARKNGFFTAETAAQRKFSAAGTAMGSAEELGVSGILPVASSAALISYHPLGTELAPGHSAQGVLASLAELREWLTLVIRYHGRGTQRIIARDAGISEPSLSKFIHGAGLASTYWAPLQKYCSHYIPYAEREQYKEDLE